MFLNKISSSKSDVISQCLLKYKYRYILKIRDLPSKNEDSLQFGSFIHKVFELGFKNNDIKELQKISEEVKGNYKLAGKIEDKTKICIENFLRFNSQLGETVATELVFEIPIAEGIDYNGVIDRVIKGKDGGYLVVDYKTSKSEKSRKALLDDNQMKAYAFAISTLYNVPLSKVYCGHYYPLSNNFVTVQFPKILIDEWKRKEIDKVWRIRKKKQDEFPPQKNMFCDWCEYKPMCPAHNDPAACDKLLEEYRNNNSENNNVSAK